MRFRVKLGADKLDETSYTEKEREREKERKLREYENKQFLKSLSITDGVGGQRSEHDIKCDLSICN